MSDFNMQPVIMQTNKGTERPVQIDDAVQSLNTGRLYVVYGINPETGKPNLWNRYHPNIRNANPKKYRIIEGLRAEVPRG